MNSSFTENTHTHKVNIFQINIYVMLLYIARTREWIGKGIKGISAEQVHTKIILSSNFTEKYGHSGEKDLAPPELYRTIL